MRQGWSFHPPRPAADQRLVLVRLATARDDLREGTRAQRQHARGYISKNASAKEPLRGQENWAASQATGRNLGSGPLGSVPPIQFPGGGSGTFRPERAKGP